MPEKTYKDFLQSKNIKHFNEGLRTETDVAKRVLLLKLLEEERIGKLTSLGPRPSTLSGGGGARMQTRAD